MTHPRNRLRPRPAGGADRLRTAASRRPLWLVAVAVLLYSTGPVMVGASSVPGPALSFWRLWFGVLVFTAISLVYARVTRRRPTRAGVTVAVAAGLAFAVHQVVFFTAIKAAGVTDVTLVNTLSPVAVGLLAVPMFGERMSGRFRWWSLVAMGGAALVVLAGSSGPSGSPLGMGLALVNVVVFSLFFLLSKRSRDHVDVVWFLAGVMVVAAVAVSGYVAVTGTDVGAATGADVGLALAIAAGPGAFGHFLMTWPLKWVPANVPPVMRLALPAISGTLAWWLLGESITAAHLVGGAVTIAGVAGALTSSAPTARPEVPASA